ACGKKEEAGNQIQILVYDKENNEIYNETFKTEEKFLGDALAKQEDLEVVTEDSDYGPFITSIKGLAQGDNYYWNYYVNGGYAEVGISQQEIKDGDVYTFKLEKFE
ncbi:MAG: DUF4430 domain-containing protein, partial [Lachnospiraceae bacterium]|nr:DUF4430 domain-containing protein [Lachnospiraceae bacterium]